MNVINYPQSFSLKNNVIQYAIVCLLACFFSLSAIATNCYDINGGSIGNSQTICSGGDAAAFTNTSSATTGQFTGVKYLWLKYVGSSAPSSSSYATVISGATSSTYDPPAGSITAKTWFRRCAAPNSSWCGSYYGESNWVSVSISAPTALVCEAKVNGTWSTLSNCSVSVCTGNSLWLSVNPNVSTVTWTGPNGFTASGNDALIANSATTTNSGTYTAALTQNGCTSTTTIQVTVSACGVNCNDITAGTIGNSQTICTGADAAAITSVTNASTTFSGGVKYVWLQYAGSSAPADASLATVISGANSATYDPPAGSITTKTWFRRCAAPNSTSCTSYYGESNWISVDVTSCTANCNDITAGTIGNSQTICTGADAAAITSVTNASTTFSGGVKYVWLQYAGASAPTNASLATVISGANSATYDPPAGSITTKTWFRRCAAPNSTSCTNYYGESNWISIDVTACGGTCSTITNVYQVTNTHDNCGTNCADYMMLLPNNGGCFLANSVFLTEYNNGTATLQGTATNSSGTVATINVTLSGKTCTGTPHYGLCITTGGGSWCYYSTMSGTITVAGIGTITVASYMHPFQMGTGANLQDNLFGASGWFTVNGSAVNQGDFNIRLTSVANLSATATSNCNNATNNISVNAAGGRPTYTYLWSNGATTQSLSNVANGIYTVTVTDANGCTTTTSITSNCALNCNDITAGSISGNQTICSGGAVATISNVTTASTSFSGGVKYIWLRYEGANAPASMAVATIISGATGSSYTPPAGSITTKTWFRRCAAPNDANCTTYGGESLWISIDVISVTTPSGATTLSNTCPATTANLTAAQPASVSTAGGVFEWRTTSSATSALVATPTAVTAGTYYLFEKSTSGCYSLPKAVTVSISSCAPTCSNITNAGTIGANQGGVAPCNPNAFTETVAPVGGSGTLEYKWQRSTDNTTWTDIAGATAISYTATNLTTTTYFRRATRRTNCTTWLNTNTVVVTVITMPTLSITDVVVSENAGTATLQVCASTTCSATMTVYYATANGTATAASDYTTKTGTLSIPVGQTCGTFTVAILDDAVVESTETFVVNLSSANNATIADNQAIVAITDNDNTGTCNNVTSGGTIGYYQSGTSPFDPGVISQTVAPTGGSGSVQYIWQSSINNSTWVTIGGATAATYDPTAITNTTYYRRGVRSTTCTEYLYSNAIMKEVIGSNKTEMIEPNTATTISDLTVAPVPAIDYINVSFEATTEQMIAVQVVDITGRLTTAQNVITTQGSNVVSFDVTQMLPGYYIVVINNGVTKQHAKFVVMR